MGAPGEITEDLINTMGISYVVHGKRANHDDSGDDPFRPPEPPIEEQARYKVIDDFVRVIFFFVILK